MVNILLESFDISSPWLYNQLKEYLKSQYEVAVIAFSFRDSHVKNIDDWKTLYDKNIGKYYNGIVESLKAYGIAEENISFLNYFTDTKDLAKEKIKSADILYFLGGLPDRMYKRIQEFDLEDVIIQHDGIVMGYSAGAVIQLSEYHLSPDNDYPEFSYYKGLPFLNDFYLEVHYENKDIQNKAIEKVLKEKNKIVYALVDGKGALIVDNGKKKILGEVKIFYPN